MKRTLWLKLALLAGAGALVALTVATLGLVPVAASRGHWPITDWFLHFTMRQSVRMRALRIEAPPLDAPLLLVRGAAHYATACASCHGAPGDPQSPLAREMTPAVPLLQDTANTWTAAQLFWIVKHGIKFTAMPAWTAQHRDDEIWPVVAFLQRLPQLSPEEYRRLAQGDGADPRASPPGAASLAAAEPPAELLRGCARCHGRDGLGRDGAFPKLAGQSEEYLLASLQAYAEGRRFSGMMQPVAGELRPEDMRQAARYFAARPAGGALRAEAADAVARGERIARDGIAAQGVPYCAACHGPKTEPRNPHYPALAGQYGDYLRSQLQLFAQARRGGSAYAPIMDTIAGRLSEEQMADVASYYEATGSFSRSAGAGTTAPAR